MCRGSKLINSLGWTKLTKGLFIWREGVPANRATRLEELKHSPPLHATHLTRTVGGLCELSLEQLLSTTNIPADQGNFFPSYFSFLQGHWPFLCPRLVYYIDLFRMTVIKDFKMWYGEAVVRRQTVEITSGDVMMRDPLRLSRHSLAFYYGKVSSFM